MNDRQKHIIDAATSLFLSDGVGVSTAKIAKAAGVSNGSLFNAFATKQDLIDQIYIHAKSGMFGALIHAGDAPFNRANMYENWQSYLAWAHANEPTRQVMHMLLEAGLASPDAVAAVNHDAIPHAAWIEHALSDGVIAGPNVTFIARLILFQIDLVISENLHGKDADLAFDMLCNAIGLTT